MEETLFKNLPLSEEITKATDELGYVTATQIQSEAIPVLLEGKDVIGLSGTGTGKTAAFSIPIIEKLDIKKGKSQVLILCPTRELAMQISDEMVKFSKYKRNIKLATIYGGQRYDKQFADLRQAHIVIGTPGRIMDHIRKKSLILANVNTVVLDEVDEMLNMGFFEDVETILSEVPEDRQTLLFSATMPPPILKVTKQFQTDPVTVKVSSERGVQKTITQLCYDVPRGRKNDALNLLLRMNTPTHSIVFCNTKKMVDELVSYLNEHGFSSLGLHGDMKQEQRSHVMREYKLGKIKVLVATDVAARGIDVQNVEAVFNYDIPMELEYYIHRVGRTGRAGKTGVSYTFITDGQQRRKMYQIQQYTGQKVTDMELPTTADIKKKSMEEQVENIVTKLDERNNPANEEILDILLEKGYDMEKIANVALQMLLSKKKINIPNMPTIKSTRKPNDGAISQTGRGRNNNSGELGGSRARAVEHYTKNFKDQVFLRVDIGRQHKIMPNHILGALLEATGLPKDRIGNIKIGGTHTDVELSKQDAISLLPIMEGKKICNRNVNLEILTSIPQDDSSNDRRPRRSSSSDRRRPSSDRRRNDSRDNRNDRKRR